MNDSKTIVSKMSKVLYGQACDIKCLKDKFLKLENFVCDLIFSGRLLKVIEILFRKLLSLGALRMLTSRIGKR